MGKIENFEKCRQRYSKQELVRINSEIKEKFNLPKLANFREVQNFLKDHVSQIENEQFGNKNKEEYFITIKSRLIASGFLLKIFHLLERSIEYINQKDFISSIAINRVCLEHQVMFIFAIDKIFDYVETKDHFGLQVIIETLMRGNRKFFTEVMRIAPGKKNQPKKLKSRNENVMTGFRHIKDKYPICSDIDAFNDGMAESCHVSPTSTLRMLYRQKHWNRGEPRNNLINARLSIISNSN